MAIRLSSTCTNCAELSDAIMCNVHEVKVNGHYTCDSFSMRQDLMLDRQCTTCTRYQQDDCAHPEKASEGMLCKSWAPVAH